jgi:hypothetical protein
MLSWKLVHCLRLRYSQDQKTRRNHGLGNLGTSCYSIWVGDSTGGVVKMGRVWCELIEEFNQWGVIGTVVNIVLHSSKDESYQLRRPISSETVDGGVLSLHCPALWGLLPSGTENSECRYHRLCEFSNLFPPTGGWVWSESTKTGK